MLNDLAGVVRVSAIHRTEHGSNITRNLQAVITVLCKSNESVIRRNSRISGLFDEKWRSFVHLESSKKIQRIFALPIVLVNANFQAVIRVY